jgi:hypothetical protein
MIGAGSWVVAGSCTNHDWPGCVLIGAGAGSCTNHDLDEEDEEEGDEDEEDGEKVVCYET